jgi:hypothetical protein
VTSQSSWVNKTIGLHTEDGSKRGFKVQTHLSGVNLVVIRHRNLSRVLPVFMNKQLNRSSHRGGQIYTTEVSLHFETSLAAVLCVKTYCLVYPRRLGGHVLNVVDV